MKERPWFEPRGEARIISRAEPAVRRGAVPLARVRRPAVVVSAVKLTTPLLCTALLLSMCCLAACPSVAPSAPSPRSTGVAPSAAIVRPARRHYDVIDARATLAPWVCLDADHAGDVSILVVLQDPVVRGAVLVTDPDGVVLGSEPMRPGSETVEILTDTPAGRPAICLHLQATEGTSVFEMRWRYR